MNFLSSRLWLNPSKLEEGRVVPQPLKMEFFDLLNPWWVVYGSSLVTISRRSLTGMFLAFYGILPYSKPVVFSEWKLKNLLVYLESRVFEPVKQKPFETGGFKFKIFKKLASGRSLVKIEALSSSWQ